MDRLFAWMLALFLLAAPLFIRRQAQPVFFSLLFPQLIPWEQAENPEEELEWMGWVMML